MFLFCFYFLFIYLFFAQLWIEDGGGSFIAIEMDGFVSTVSECGRSGRGDGRGG